MAEHSRLWNDLPKEERARLMPHQIETQILHYEQMRQLIVQRHKATVAEIDAWIANLKRTLRSYEMKANG